MLARAFGVPAADDEVGLLEAAFRHLVLAELMMVTGEAPAGLERAVAAATAEQRRRSSELLATWRRDRLRVRVYRERALSAEAALGLAQALRWHPDLVGLDKLPVLEDLALGEVVRLLDDGLHGQARELAERLRTLSM